MRDADWQADMRRYPPRPLLREQSAWAILIYRYGRMLERRSPSLRRWMAERWYWVAYRAIETLSGISIPKSVSIGPGLRIWHFGGIVVHNDVVIGSRCTLRQGVTIGNAVDGGPVPVLGDDVALGAYAQILGGVRVGNGAKIGAMSVVLDDVPAGTTVVGVPARVVRVSEG
jgi:serine O-acetyltransferase